MRVCVVGVGLCEWGVGAFIISDIRVSVSTKAKSPSSNILKEVASGSLCARGIMNFGWRENTLVKVNNNKMNDIYNRGCIMTYQRKQHNLHSSSLLSREIFKDTLCE